MNRTPGTRERHPRTAPRTAAGRELLAEGEKFIREAYPEGLFLGADGWDSSTYGTDGLTREETWGLYGGQLRRAILAIEAEAAASREVPPEPPRPSGWPPRPEGPGARADALHRAWVENGGDYYYGDLFWEGVVANFAVIARYAEEVIDRSAPSPEPVAAPPAPEPEAKGPVEGWVRAANGRHPGHHGDRLVYTLQINESTVERAREALRMSKGAALGATPAPAHDCACNCHDDYFTEPAP